ncbi:CRP-like cAMP-binding protein [Mesonia hippocampi]|uniref:CRP-like cAMP-binding protein n=1 Tax=Mesonia hippocampi TaxID=1628250 RepID=A0A840ENI9_9FLAO|nr:Crp/Fnr family transcriptional regulator [Mesonia hippocampi]MBB4118631.1 CRP-like cAMP-binding protein [Mesonia hippocampi]
MNDALTIKNFHEQLAIKFPYVEEQSWNKLQNISMVQKLNKNELLCKEGQKLNHGIFVVSGQLKLFYLNESGIERIASFCTRNDYIDNWNDVHQHTALPYSICAISTTTIVKYPLKEMVSIFKQNPDLLQLCIDLSQEIIGKKQDHYQILTLKTPKDRYLWLQKNRPQWLQDITLTELSKYLHVSRETLSRVRSKLLR